MADPDLEIRQSLISKIERAFGDVQRGNGITLHQARVIDDAISTGAGEKEENEARQLDTDTRWQDIPREWIEELGDDFLFIDDPEGFRYYLPAFMIYSLRYYDTSCFVALDEVAFVLDSGSTNSDILRRCKLLDLQQRQVVATFLQWYARLNQDDVFCKHAQSALDQYWHQYL